MERIPKPHQLPKKPLVEAIFEVRWKLEQKDGGIIDPGFQLLLSRFYDKVMAQFPEFENLVPASLMPEPMTPSMVRHRFRKAKNSWPLIQLGPGVMSVNETEGYTWSGFRPMLKMAVESLLQAYPTNLAKLQISQVTLRYIDALPLETDGAKREIIEFLKDYLHTDVSVDPLLFEDPSTAGKPSGLNIRLNYPLTRPAGVGVLSFASGMRENVPSVIWETIVVSRDDQTPSKLAEFEVWFDEAHDVTDRWFFTLSRGPLLTSFGGNNDAE
jgi:uncharacterized protein (TIGR04255 family)